MLNEACSRLEMIKEEFDRLPANFIRNIRIKGLEWQKKVDRRRLTEKKEIFNRRNGWRLQNYHLLSSWSARRLNRRGTVLSFVSLRHCTLCTHDDEEAHFARSLNWSVPTEGGKKKVKLLVTSSFHFDVVILYRLWVGVVVHPTEQQDVRLCKKRMQSINHVLSESLNSTQFLIRVWEISRAKILRPEEKKNLKSGNLIYYCRSWPGEANANTLEILAALALLRRANNLYSFISYKVQQNWYLVSGYPSAPRETVRPQSFLSCS